MGNWSNTELEVLKKEYCFNRNLFALFKNKSFSGIYHKANRLNLTRQVKPLNFIIDEAFFNNWSKELAYFLGFFMADGSLDMKRKRAMIKINKKDRYILEEFSKIIKTNRPIKEGANYVAFIINDTIIIKKLIEFGCVPGNSIKNKLPKDLPAELFFHFLRGYIDGDGSIYISKSVKSRQKNVLRLNILGSKEFLQIIRLNIQKLLGIKLDYKICSTSAKELYSITFNGERARVICFNLYKERGSLFLERKKNIFYEHLRGLKYGV